jgi:hypothetical protein
MLFLFFLFVVSAGVDCSQVSEDSSCSGQGTLVKKGGSVYCVCRTGYAGEVSFFWVVFFFYLLVSCFLLCLGFVIIFTPHDVFFPFLFTFSQ